MLSNLVAFIVITVILVGVACVSIILNYIHLIECKKKEENELNPGDVIVKVFEFDNPFVDWEWMCETVTEVKRNNKGKTYFKSYTSNINGERHPYQITYKPSHCEGEKYFREDWKKVNHINL